MNTTALVQKSYRLLVIDDNPTIHEDIRKILNPTLTGDALQEAEVALFGGEPAASTRSAFRIDSAYQGQEGLALVAKALAEESPYSMAFVDVRMPPGWDGVETIQRIWQRYPDLQVVICTAYSDRSWDEIIQQLGKSDNLVILKKPFDNVEVLQLAHALTKKWVVTAQARGRLDELEAVVQRRTEELVRANHSLQAEVDRRTRVEAELRTSEERFHQSFRSTSVALTILRADTLALTDVNESFLALSGYRSEEVLGKTPFELNLPEDTARFRELFRKLEAGEAVKNSPECLRSVDQQLRQVLCSIIKLALGSQPSYLMALLDVTDQRRLEQQLRQSQKMEAIGQLAAGVAHDFNNLLTIIIGNTDLLLSRPAQDPAVGKSLAQVKQASQRAAGLTRQLLAFSRKQVIQRRPLQVGDSMSRLRQILERLIGETVTLQCEWAEQLLPVLADESSFEQIILNLAVNARDAMPNGGTLRMSVREVEILGAESPRHPDARPGKFIAIEVQDTGTGMDPATLSRVFEPFFTTKPPGKGTGLGLSTVFGIVQQHEGWVEVSSKVGAGTTFVVFLPVTNQRLPNVAEVSVVPAAAGSARGRTILVVEDEDSVRSFVCEALRSEGYQVLDVASVDEAMVMWSKKGPQVDVLLTDMVMPGLNGKLLARRLRQSKENLKLVYMSGYCPDLHATEHWTREKPVVLQKPFDRTQLTAAIDKAFSAPGAPDLGARN